LQQLFLLQQVSQGSQHEVASQQLGSQQLSPPQHEAASQHEGSQQLFLQHFFLQSNMPQRPPKRSHFFLQQLFLQHEVASQQLGSQQADASQQLGSQQLDSQQPPPLWWFRPSMRSRSSKPKLWVHNPALMTSAPKTMCHFIEQRLLK